MKWKLANGVGSQYSHTTSERGVSSISNADVHTSATSSLLNSRPRRFQWTRPFRRKKKSCFCACAIRFQTQSNTTTYSRSPDLKFRHLGLLIYTILHTIQITQRKGLDGNVN